jgi:hypothetical protein
VATRIQIATIVPPDSDAMAAFVVSMRSLLAASAAATRSTALSVDLYLFGAYTSQLDVQNTLYGYAPTDVCVTLALVLVLIGGSFGSVVLALRLLVTVLISLCVTYGAMVRIRFIDETQCTHCNFHLKRITLYMAHF